MVFVGVECEFAEYLAGCFLDDDDVEPADECSCCFVFVFCSVV